MVNQQILAGKWNEVRGKLKEKWGKLTDDDVRAFNGNVDQLVGRIQHKTGESREAIEDFLGRVADEGSNIATELRDQIEAGASEVADRARQGYDALREGYAEAGRVVQQRPGQSLAVAFGLGLITGLGAALLLRERRSDTVITRGRAATEQFGKQMLDALSGMLPDALTKVHR
jgi:uncharacterized protein YjbJ (UPF0337 family)